MTECASALVSTYRFYTIKSFHMHAMKNSMHSRIETKAMKQVHCFKKRYYCGDQVFTYFVACCPEAQGTPISILNSHKD